MKQPKILSMLRLAALVAIAAVSIQKTQATPYASCITNDGANNITFFLNESNANVTVTYDNATTNASFNGINTGTNLARGNYVFSLAGHTSYSISVFKNGTGAATVIASKSIPTPRGVDVNKLGTSPYFGQVYVVNAAVAATNLPIQRLNSDLTGIATNGGAVAWVVGSASSPYRLAVNDDGFLTVGDFSSAHSGVWRIDPQLISNQLLLGPVGQTAGYAAGSQGDQFSRPLLVGNLAAGGNAVLFTVDAGAIPGVNASKLNSVLVYSNISLATIPRITPPDLVGPEVCLNQAVNNNYPGITYSGGYIYCSNRRDGPSGGTADLQIFDSTNFTQVWNSFYNGVVNDYFAVNGTGPADSAVSADGKYIAAIGFGNNQLIVCSLTNGIPDVSTLYTTTNPASQTSAGRGLCWDAADNVYLTSSGGTFLQEWTLGFTATAITTGNASGPTGFLLTTPSTVVSVVATNSIMTATLSQVNTYGNPTSATFLVTRSGSVSSPLTVAFSFSGTAAAGTYTSSANGTFTFAAGQSATNINIIAVSDGIARPTTTIILTVATSGNYTLAPASATLALINTAPNVLLVSPAAASMYNAFSNDYASFAITRLGDTNAAAYTVSSYTSSGTAVAGVDYVAPGPVTFNPGDLSQTNFISPLSSGQLPVDSSANVYVGNKTAIIGIGTGTGYTGATNKALLDILDSAFPTTTVLFADPLTDPADAANWVVTSGNNNMQTNAIDDTITFGYDLQNGDPGDFGAIPLPPSGAATALRLSVNKTQPPGSGASAGFNIYPANVTFSGNYAVRFNMNIIEGLATSSSTEGPLFGINHSGKDTNWFSASAILSGWGTPATNTWTADGVWYWINADNDYTGGAYIEFTGAGGTNNNTGWQQPATSFPPPFANAFKTNVFTGGAAWVPGLVANGSIQNGYTANNWADVEIKQLNNLVTLSIDKTTVFTYTNNTVFTNGKIMLGYEDPFSSVGSIDGAAYFSNLRVVSLASPSISQIAVNKVNGTAVINFTTVDGDMTSSSFALQGTAALTVPFADIAGASITPLSAGAFQAVVPLSGSVEFYRIRVK